MCMENINSNLFKVLKVEKRSYKPFFKKQIKIFRDTPETCGDIKDVRYNLVE